MAADHRLDDALLIWAELQLGLRDLRQSNGEFLNPKPGKRGRDRRAQVERSFLESFLLRLEEAAEEASPKREIQVNVARAGAMQHLARRAHESYDLHAAEMLLLQGLAFAREAGYPPSLYAIGMALGHVYREMPDPGRAEEHYKQALGHAASYMPEFNVPTTLFWLGMNAATSKGGLSQAIFLFDCASRFDPPNFSALVEMQRCRIRAGQRKQVLRFAEPPFGSTCREVGLKSAALKALRNKTTELRDAAAYGAELACQKGEERWERLFTAILNEPK